ncbi:MAG: cell division protein SepF [Candidatus Subteraquimicrobiales bacterium]|nr:cell division protein SepF [Candidatus Subteraquimicrobiales bacterium]
MRDLWRKLLNYFGFGEEDYEEYDEDYEEEIEPVQAIKKLHRSPDLTRVDKTRALRSISTPQTRVHIVEPKSFNDAQQIADKFKANIPVIMNLQVGDAELSKRLIDFASGLTYGLDGSIQKIAERVFLLTPSNVEVSEAERRSWREKGLFNQLDRI